MDVINEIISDYINHKVNAEVKRQTRLIIDTFKEKVLPIITDNFEKRQVEQWLDLVKERIK